MKTIKNLKITDTAYGGYGVGKLDNGYTIFVPYTVENDVVDVEVFLEKKRFSFAKPINFIEKSELRKNHELICPHFAECGNCQFGHIKYEDQIKIKKRLLKNFFRKIEGFTVNNTIFDKNKEYRFRTTFRINNKKLGFLKFKTNDFVPINSCQILKPSVIENGMNFAKEISQNGKLYVIENENGEFLANFNKKPIVTRKHIKIFHDFGFYYVGHNSFSQSNRFLLSKFAESVLYHIDEHDSILELYAGSGFFTQPIDKKAKKIIAVESNKESVTLMKMLNLNNTEIINKKVENLNFNDFSANTLLIDPPRSGIDKNVLNKIMKQNFEKIIYVSCNPATMARDTEKLSQKYNLSKFIFIDMFPETYHIESIGVLTIK